MRTAKPEDWKTRPLPARRTTIALNRTFSAPEIARMRRGLVPKQMEDKWFIYWQDDALFFHRSWTGICIYIVRFAAERDGGRMVEAEVNRDPKQYKEVDDAADAAMISFLVDVLLLHRPAAFPGADPASADSALRMWSQVGRAMLGQHPDDEGTVPPDALADPDPTRQ